jgi:hypothetical protein
MDLREMPYDFTTWPHNIQSIRLSDVRPACRRIVPGCRRVVHKQVPTMFKFTYISLPYIHFGSITVAQPTLAPGSQSHQVSVGCSLNEPPPPLKTFRTLLFLSFLCRKQPLLWNTPKVRAAVSRRPITASQALPFGPEVMKGSQLLFDFFQITCSRSDVSKRPTVPGDH